MLDAQVRCTIGELDLDVALAAADGETVAVLGPNGAGKTTLLRALAGLVPIEAGRIVIDDVVVDDPARRAFVVPERRVVGVMFQEYLLFPHMTVSENVAFPLRSRGVRRGDAPPAPKSGWRASGSRIAARRSPQTSPAGSASESRSRALVAEPKVLLLDEPLAALDVGTRAELRRDLRTQLASFPGVRVLVTHDLLDAVALADRLVVLERGRVAQEGPVAEVTARPRSRYVAELVGTNLLRGTGADHTVALAGGGAVVTADPVDGDVYVAIPPHAVSLHRQSPEGSARNVWRGTVQGADLLGDRVRIHVKGEVPLVAEVTAAAVTDLGLHDGVEVWATVKATELTTYPA